MFKDKFIGGPLDGEVRDVAQETLGGANVRDRETQVEYARAPHLDTEDVRAWIVAAPEPEPVLQQAPAPAVRRAPTPPLFPPDDDPVQVIVENKRCLTLGEVARFVDAARANGWQDHQEVEGVSGWSLRLRKLSMRKN
ncbi:hypothetical protein [Nesterenkonia sp. HG001]|uniref:hypothetical protein n=1 Tax=Nesterenkonia sp. HG001 TaxID=2983207 RepID=UPI002AC4E79B|nr:hypothetical protein [Nesterenkonia sp. HG001]MDZ5076751.1 hypothetical protein [Nesterenkonia sp. HG001]